MSILAYWIFLFATLFIEVVIIRKKGLHMMEFIMALTLMAASCFGDKIFSLYYGLFIYIHEDLNLIYAMIYDFVVYPACGILFSLFFPKEHTMKSILLYCLKWTSLLLIVEVFIIDYFDIITYTGWKIFPHSALFYLITLPLASIYYLIVLKFIKKDNHA
jgi:hypothetical protein